MFWDVEVTPEEEEEMIRKTAEKIHEYGMDVPALLMLGTLKPLAFIGGQMSRLFISPILPVFGEDIGRGGDKFLSVFEKRENVEKLIALLEKLEKGEELKPEEGKIKAEEEQKTETEKPPQKRGWKRFLPF